MSVSSSPSVAINAVVADVVVVGVVVVVEVVVVAVSRELTSCSEPW